MSVIRKIQWDSIYSSRPGRQWLLALGLAVTPWFAAVSWAENFNLESVDFKTGGDQTSVILHTGSIVPVQKIMTSDNKLILEIDQVNAHETVRTNFSGATNISHVIMQPVNDHKVRMIIRGENLSPPTVAFFNPSDRTAVASNPDFQSGESFHRQTQEALRQIQDSGVQSASLKPEAEQSLKPEKAPKVETKPAKTEAKSALDLVETESIPFGGLVENNTPISHPAQESVKPALPASTEKMKPLNLPSMEMPAVGNELIEAVQKGRYNNYILGGLLALLALGVGGFVIYKVLKLRQVEPDLEELLLEQHNGKKVSFKEMASAYRSKHDQGRKPESTGFASKPGGKKQVEDVIGLRSLNQMEPEALIETTQPRPAAKKAAPQPQAAADPFGGKTPTMEQLISMVQAVSEPKQAPMKTPAPSKQVVNQYKQAEKPKSQPVKKATFPDETMVKEMKRAQALQQELLQQAQQQIASAQNRTQSKTAPVNRAAAAQKAVKPVDFKTAPATSPANARKQANASMNPAAVGKNGPLPGNPEVLNFLRNVADLMEKDGKPKIASSIHKNLNPTS